MVEYHKEAKSTIKQRSVKDTLQRCKLWPKKIITTTNNPFMTALTYIIDSKQSTCGAHMYGCP